MEGITHVRSSSGSGGLGSLTNVFAVIRLRCVCVVRTGPGRNQVRLFRNGRSFAKRSTGVYRPSSGVDGCHPAAAAGTKVVEGTDNDVASTHDKDTTAGRNPCWLGMENGEGFGKDLQPVVICDGTKF